MPVGVAVVLASSNARAGTPSAKMRFPVADEVVLLVDPVLLGTSDLPDFVRFPSSNCPMVEMLLPAFPPTMKEGEARLQQPV